MYQDTYDETRNAFVNRQRAIADNAWTEQGRSANVLAGKALATGDYAGATNALYNVGDIEGGQKVQTYSDTQRVQHAQAAQRISQGIRAAVNAGHTPQEAYDMATQIAPQLGVDPVDLQKMRPAFDKDPRAFLDMVDQQAKKELQFFQTDAGILAGDKNTGNVKMAYGLPGKPIEMDRDKSYIAPNTTVGPPGAAPQPQATTPTAPAGKFDSAGFIKSFVLPHEGGLNPSDINGSPTNFGINQKANPNVNVAKLTADQAAQIYQSKYLPMSGAESLPPALAGPVLDTAVINPAKARQFLQQSGGDPSKFMDLREQWLAQVAKTPGGAKYAKAWANRNADLRSYIAQNGGSTAAQGGAGSPIDQTGAPPGYHFIQRAAAAGDEGNLTPDAIEQNAMRYVMTGQMPALGQKAKEERNAILNRSAAIAKQYDIKPEDVVTGMAQFKVTQGSLAQISKVASMVQASENTVVANADLALSLAPKGGGPTGSPVLNRWIQAGRKSIAGDADVAKFDAALGTVADEYAKVMTTSTGTGGAGTSDSARNEAYHRLNSAMTYQQLQGVIDTMKREMANRTQALDGQRTALTEQLRHGVVPGGQAAQPGAQPQSGPAAAPTPQPANANGYHPAQIATARRLTQAPNFRSTPLGQPGNPYAPRNAAEFQAIPNGKSYIDDDGQVYVKGRR